MRSLATLVLIGLIAPSLYAQTPTINVWEGTTQTFGALGHPQRWVNVLGNVTDKQAVTTLTYTLNGGTAVSLNMGPNNRRLLQDGDFNIDIDRALLNNGANTVVITATTSGSPVTQTVTVNYVANSVWPGNFSIDWSQVTKPTDVVQLVDGKWSHTGAGIRPDVLGYDRTFVVGDITWQNFEVVVPITVHGLDPSSAKYSSTSVSPGFGFTGRWTGHTQLSAGEQPLQYWLPQGGGPWYDFGKQNGSPKFILAGSDGLYINDPQNRTVSFGTKYWWRLRVEKLPSGDTWYGLKMWPDSGSEPTLFDMSGTEGTVDLQNGSVIFVAHHVDLTVGNLQTTALSSETTPPAIVSPSAAPTQTSASITWTTDEVADSSVAYGKTTSYEIGTVALSSLATGHQITLSGLSASTEYHYKITSKDGRGNAASTSDLTFTTQAGGGGGGGLTTDTFGGTTLDSVWQTIDPLSDATFTVSGGKLSISASSTATHDVWTNSNDLPRVMRSTPDADLDVQVKFDSPLATGSGQFRSQGILIQESGSHVLRLELHSVSGTVKVFAARLKNGQAKIYTMSAIPVITSTTSPMFLRVTRTGDNFKLFYSLDGASWTQATSFTNAMTAVSIGVFAGNSAGLAHTAVIDTFQVNYVGSSADTTPPVISAVSATPANTSATVGWTTNEPATSVVEYGLTSAYGGSTNNGAALSTSHSISLTGLASNTTYHYRVISSDASNNTSTGVDRTFVTSGDTTAPVISAVAVSASSVAASVSWTTNEVATSVVDFGTSSSYGNSVSNGSSTNTSRTLVLTGLSPNTTYHYRVTSADPAGNSSNTGDLTFLTPSNGGSVAPPRSDEFATLDVNKWTFVDPLNDSTIGGSEGRAILSIPASATVHDAWTASNTCPRITQSVPDSDFDVEVVFDSVLGGSSFKSQGILIEQGPTDVIRIEFLRLGGSTKVFVATIFGGSATTRTFQDVTVSAPMSLRVARSGNSWTIRRSTGSSGYTAIASFTQAMTVNKIAIHAGCATDSHQISIDRFVVHSGGGDTTPPVISAVQVSGSTVSWTTDEPASSEVRYGLTSNLESTPVTSSALTTSHSLALPNLQASTQYYYRVVSEDASGNTAMSTIASFTTASGDTTPPVISNVAVTGSTVTWTTNESATSQVRYGLTTNLELNPVGAAAYVTSHTVVLPNLSASTRYYYQVVSEDAAGNSASSSVMSFVTGAGGLTTDLFNGNSIDFTTWTFLDAQQDCTLSASGGAARISIPSANVIHDVWTASNDLGRLMQSAPSTDWTVEAKFDSTLSGANFKSQGILVEVDPTNVIRTEFFVSGGKVHVFCASIFGGSATIRAYKQISPTGSTYLRVGHTGNTWTVQYSMNGTSWSTAATFNLSITPAKVGVYAGSGANTSHTVVIDHFKVL